MLFSAIDKSRCGITFGCHRCTGKAKDCRLLFKPPKSASVCFRMKIPSLFLSGSKKTWRDVLSDHLIHEEMTLTDSPQYLAQ